MGNEEKLVKMLNYVSEHNDFYKKRIKEYGITNPLDITQWPVLTRKELQENRYNMFSDGYKSKYFNQQLRRQSSSGSTGMPVNVYWDYKDWYASNMCLWRKRLEWYGIHPKDKCIVFTLAAFNSKNDNNSIYYTQQPDNILSVNVSLIQQHSGYDKLIYIINEFEPKWLYVQPFVLNQLILAYKRTSKMPPKSLKYIESTGEVLPEFLKRVATDFFNIPLANMYGSEEMNGIAYEDLKHHMQVISDNVYLEIIDAQGMPINNIGNAIITNLNNRAMPLIRYEQGDTLEIIYSKNDGAHLFVPTIIRTINGRFTDSINMNNNFKITSALLMEIIAETNNYFEGAISEYIYIFSKSEKQLICSIKLNEQCSTGFEEIRRIIKGIFTQKSPENTLCNFDVALMEQSTYKKEKNRILYKVD